MKKHKYNIINLDCANCARKLEETLNKDERLNNVIVNFNTSKLSYESDIVDLKEINRLVKEVEPECIISEEEKESKKEYHFSILILGVLFGLISGYIQEPLKWIFILTSYILLLYRPFINAIKLLVKSKTINENALITISCIGALIVNQFLEGVMVVALYSIGKILEEKAINNTRTSIKGLIDMKQDYANKVSGKSFVKVDVEEVKVGDILLIKSGERIPLDGKVVKGSTYLDMSMLTGESELVNVTVDSNVLSGSINQGDIIEIEVTSELANSTVTKILSLVEEATDKKAKTETLVSRLSKVYTPIVLLLACLVTFLLPLFTNLTLDESFYRGLTFLVIACPCAIAISVPLSYFTGIGVSSKNGILIKGSNYLDNLSHVKEMIFDKTGTLTTGTFEIDEIIVDNDKYTKDEIIELLIKGESLSNHPIAQSILKLSNNEIDNSNVKEFKEIAGIGVSYKIGNKHIKVGTSKICNDCSSENNIHVNINNQHIASITLKDGIKENTKDIISALHNKNIKTVMFTGDKKDIAKEIGNKLGIDEIKYEMLPNDKYNEYEKRKNANDIIVYVGDGINDAPVLKRADIGISMGSIGSESAIEASDIVIMTDDLNKIIKAINISEYTNFIIKQNLVFALSVKLIILIMSVFGFASMWAAVFADTGVTLLTILNTLRILRKFNVRK